METVVQWVLSGTPYSGDLGKIRYFILKLSGKDSPQRDGDPNVSGKR